MRIKFFGCILIFLFIATLGLATTYYVAKDGNDGTGDGSEELPWLTIVYGESQLSAGDTLIVEEGRYEERLDLTQPGTGIAYITIKAKTAASLSWSGADETISASISNPAAITSFRGVDTNAQDYVKIQDFVVTDIGVGNRAGIFVENGTTYVEIEGLYIYTLDCDVNYWGAVYASETGNPSYITIKDNTFHKVEGAAITAAGSYWTVDNNDVSRGTDSNQTPEIVLNDCDSMRFFGNNHTIKNNFFHDYYYADSDGDPHIDALMTFSNEGIDTYDNAIEKNYFKSFHHQIFITSDFAGGAGGANKTHDNIFRNNLCVNAGYGTTSYMYSHMDHDGLETVNNVFAIVNSGSYQARPIRLRDYYRHITETGGLWIADCNDAGLADFDSTTAEGSNTFTAVRYPYTSEYWRYKLWFNGTDRDCFGDKALGSAYTDVYARTYFEIDSAGMSSSTKADLISLRDSATSVATLFLYKTATGLSYQVYTRDNAGWALLLDGSGSDKFSEDTEYCIELRWLQGGGSGGAQVWIDGVSDASDYTETNTNYDIENVRIGSDSDHIPTNGATWFLDDIKVAETAVGVIVSKGGCHDAIMKNNIFYGFNWGMDFGDAASLVDSEIDYNLWSNDYGSPDRIVGQQANSIFGEDPLFVSAAGYNFHLQESSPADETGVDLSALGFSDDKDDVSRPQGTYWDIGAYEYAESGLPISRSRYKKELPAFLATTQIWGLWVCVLVSNLMNVFLLFLVYRAYIRIAENKRRIYFFENADNFVAWYELNRYLIGGK